MARAGQRAPLLGLLRGRFSFFGGPGGISLKKSMGRGILETYTEEGVSCMAEGTNETMHFRIEKEKDKASDVIMRVYAAMEEKGYDPVNQIVGYLISGDPTYITSYNNARYLIRMLERDELLEELVRFYVEAHEAD